MCSNPKCDGPLSNFAVNFNMRRYEMAAGTEKPKVVVVAPPAKGEVIAGVDVVVATVGRCWLTSS
jgi:hypothetical protein